MSVAVVPVLPKSIKVFVTGGKITVHNGAVVGPEAEKVWALAGGSVWFVIENGDTEHHMVSIPIKEIVPAKGYKDPATAGEPFVPGTDTVVVPAGETAVLRFRIKPASHFEFATKEPWKSDPNKGMTYKYTVRSISTSGKKVVRDPDIEIRP
jgi:hypothetical protein